VRCPRCSGFAYILAHGKCSEADEYLRCLVCGAWTPLPRLRVIITAAEIAAELAPRGIVRAPCTVIGCTETVRTNHSLTNVERMCARHHQMLADWRRGKGTTPAPLILEGDAWRENPHRVIVAERQAKPRRRPCARCGEIKSIQWKEHCYRCSRIVQGLPTSPRRQPKTKERKCAHG